MARSISKLNTKITVKIVKTNALTIVVNLGSVIQVIQIFKRIVHTNMYFAALSVMTSPPVYRKYARLLRMASP